MPVLVALEALEQPAKAGHEVAVLHLVVAAQPGLDADLTSAGGVPGAEAVVLRHPLREVGIGLDEL